MVSATTSRGSAPSALDVRNIHFFHLFDLPLPLEDATALGGTGCCKAW